MQTPKHMFGHTIFCSTCRILLITLFIFVATSCADDDNKIASYWESCKPEDVGIDSDALAIAFSQASAISSIYSLLVIRNGLVIGEEHYQGYKAGSYHNVRSVSKSFLSALVGIALDEGIIDSVDQKILTYFPEYSPNTLPHAMGDVTIRHLLTMTAGYEHKQANYFDIFSSEHWVETILNFGLQYDPGSTFSYNTCQTHLLSAILTRASGKSTKALMNEYLLYPLDIEVGAWEKDADGIYYGGNNMHFTTRDMAKLGYLYMNGGIFEGQQLVPSSWVDRSTTATFEGTRNWGDLKSYSYGYLWWMGELAGYPSKIAIGHGGQFIIFVPQLDMVIAATSNPDVDWARADVNEQAVLGIVANYILPSVISD